MRTIIGGDLAPRLGGRTKNFSDFFKETISVFMPKISDDLFLVIVHVISLLRVISYMTLLPEKNPYLRNFFTLFVLSRASDKHYFSQILGPSAQSPLGLRP